TISNSPLKKFFFILFLPFIVVSQNTNDAGMWNTFSLQKSLNKKLYLTLDQEMRLRENYSRLNLFYTNLGVGFKLNKNFKAELTYRFIQKYQIDNSFSLRHRIMLDLSYKKKFSKIIFSNRLRYQAE